MGSGTDENEFRVVEDEPGWLFGQFGPIVTVVTREPPSVPGVQRFVSLARNTVSEHPDGIAAIMVFRARRPRLDPDVTREIVEAWGDLGPSVRAAAVVIDAGGFIAAVQRSLVTAMTTAIRGKVPAKVFNSPKQACEWICPQVPSVGRSVVVGIAFERFLITHAAPG